MSAEQAAARPLPGTHGIWEIVLHMTAWLDAVRRRLEGEPLELSPEQDWPAIHDAERSCLAGRPGQPGGCARETARRHRWRSIPTRLDERAPGKPYSIYFMLHGAIQHNLYHAGQIALLKKA